SVGSVAPRLDAAFGTHFLELAVGEEPDPAAVRRPERLRRVVGPWNRPAPEHFERTQPELNRPRRVGGGEDDHASVGRDRAVNAVAVEGRPLRLGHREPHYGSRLPAEHWPRRRE